MVIFLPFEYFNWLQPTGELSRRVNIRIYVDFHLFNDHFLTNNYSDFHHGGCILVAFFTRKVCPWLCGDCVNKFFLENVQVVGPLNVPGPLNVTFQFNHHKQKLVWLLAIILQNMMRIDVYYSSQPFWGEQILISVKNLKILWNWGSQNTTNLAKSPTGPMNMIINCGAASTT